MYGDAFNGRHAVVIPEKSIRRDFGNSEIKTDVTSLTAPRSGLNEILLANILLNPMYTVPKDQQMQK